MRVPMIVLASLAVAASARGGCVPDETATAPVDDECAELACGASCAYCPDGAAQCPVPTFAPTACDARGACVTAGTFSCDPSACEGRKCGDACAIEPPCRSSDPPCMMPTMMGNCDVNGQCTTAAPSCVPHDPCAGKACGDRCHPCPPDAIDCVEPAVMMACDAGGRCVMESPPACPP